MTALFFFVNGSPVTIDDPDPRVTLLTFLRSHLHLTGTKLGCAEGGEFKISGIIHCLGCGACTVMLSSYDPQTSSLSHVAVNACLAPLCSVHGKHVITVEGIGSSENPHPVQERIAKLFGSQCGFCTPGIVMSLYALIRSGKKLDDHTIEEAFDGNLCRCTGYRPILDAAKTFVCGLGDKCCKNQPSSSETNKEEFLKRWNVTLKPYNPSQDIIFPPALINYLQKTPHTSLSFSHPECTWHRPVSMTDLLQFKATYPDAKIVGGNTEVGIEVKFKKSVYPVLITPMDVVEMKKTMIKEGGVEFGAAMTLSAFVLELKQLVSTQTEYATGNFKALLENLRWFAGNQIRNVATIAGNIATASPISDMNPVFLASDSILTCVKMSSDGNVVTRKVKMSEFFLGYRKTALEPSELITSIFVPFTKKNEYVFAYKQAKRRDDDIAIVTACLKATVSSSLLHNVSFAFGGIAPTTILLPKLAQKLEGCPLDSAWSIISSTVLDEVSIPFSAPGGAAAYRRALVLSFFVKFISFLKSNISSTSTFDSCHERIERPVSKGIQVLTPTSSSASSNVGKTIMHQSALKQVTGEAQYLDDIPKQFNELYGGLVMSTHAHARIVSMDFSDALSHPGVKGVVCHKDVPRSNIIGPVFKDEELFATDKVLFYGQLIALVLGENQQIAQEAARKVKVEYEPLPAIVTIEEAIEKNSFFDLERCMARGDLEKGFQESDYVIEGEVRVGGQNHFYLETHASLVIPKPEDGEMEIWSSSQHPTEIQHLVASTLGISDNKVVCRVKRMGGGFGGKESRAAPLACALAVAARKFKRPVRCMLDREEDMILNGARHPFLGKYKIGFRKDGKLVAADVQLFSNAGYSFDLSHGVLERAVAHADNVYYVPNIKVTGKLCKTNTHTNTAFRGFGGPQGMLIAETWITHMSETLGKPELNFYQEGQPTHFNQKLEDLQIPRLWSELKTVSEFRDRRLQVDHFNKQNRYRKRGLSLLPTKFGIAFGARFMNQAGALVHIYTDGSVLLTHGGTEMGQGLHTKMIQICADALNVDMDSVHIAETATDKVPNTSPTAASASSDLNGMAIMDACQQLMRRLKPYYDLNPNATLKEVARAAFMDRVSLSAAGFHATPDLSYEWGTNQGRLFNYFTYGAAVSEVEVDVLTGEFQVLRADVIMDLGRSLNPGVDIGQIEGAFVQGMGWSTIEELLHFPNGVLFTRGPGNYKIPGFTDIPIDFRVSLLENAENSRAIHSSKAVGEPPLFLGSSVFLAIRDAVKASREAEGVTGYFRFDAPSTPEIIRMACVDECTTLALSIPRKEGEKPWYLRA